MSERWYYRLFGEEFGPVPMEAIQDLSENGTLGPADELRGESRSEWVTLEQALQSSGTATAVLDLPDEEETDDPEPDVSWYCKIAGQELGPFAFEELVSFAEEGQLTAEDEIRFGGEGLWRRAGSVGRLVAVLPYGKPGLREVPARMKPAGVSKTPQAKSRSAATDDAPAKPPRKPAAEKPPIPPELAWYAWIKGKQHGPMTLEQVTKLIQAGRISAKDFVKQTANGTWGPPQSALDALVFETVGAPPEGNGAAEGASTQPATNVKTAPVIDTQTVVTQVPVTRPAPIPEPVRAAYVPPAPAAKPAWKPPPKAKKSSGGGGMKLNLGPLLDPKILGGVVAAALVVGWFFLPAGKGRDIAHLKTLQSIGDEFKATRESNGDWSKLEARIKNEIPPMVKDMKSRATPSRPYFKQLIWAADLRIPQMMKEGRQKETAAEKEFYNFLKSAAVMLGVEKADTSAPPPPSASDV